MQWIDDLRDLLKPYSTWLWGLGIFSALSMLLGALLVPVWLARLPADHFRSPRRLGDRPWTARRVVGHLLLNLLGAVLVAAGIVMLVLPGQGVLTILLGLGLLEFPGKHRIEGWIVRRRPVRAALDWLRRRRGAEPFDLDSRGMPPDSGSTRG